MELRTERDSDHRAITEVIAAAFGERGRDVAELVADLRNSATSDVGLSLVAEHEGTVIGHLMFSSGLLDAPARLVPVQVLSPLAVLPKWQRRGVGSSLVRRGIAVMTGRSVPVIFVEGDPSYYSRFGFKPGSELGYRRPSLRIPEPAFQAMQLPAHEAWMTGTFVYSAAFWDHDAVGLREDWDQNS
jgi:putative acetyltransferase